MLRQYIFRLDIHSKDYALVVFLIEATKICQLSLIAALLLVAKIRAQHRSTVNFWIVNPSG